MIKIKAAKSAQAKVGIYPAEVVKVTKDEKRSQWTIVFKLPNGASVEKSYPDEIEDDDPTHRELKKIAGKGIAVDKDFDPDKLKGNKPVIVVGAKRSTGGRVTPTVALIMTPDEFVAASNEITAQIKKNETAPSPSTPEHETH
jgi:hypothetical protein